MGEIGKVLEPFGKLIKIEGAEIEFGKFGEVLKPVRKQFEFVIIVEVEET